MNAYTEKIKTMLQEDQILDMQDILRVAYEIYANRHYESTKEMLQAYQKMENLTAHMLFPQRDAILCAANALGAQYEMESFCDGFRTGAALVLGLMAGVT